VVEARKVSCFHRFCLLGWAISCFGVAYLQRLSETKLEEWHGCSPMHASGSAKKAAEYANGGD
jgi:hypothetical protein